MRVKEQCRDHYNCEISVCLSPISVRHILLDEEDPAPCCVIDNQTSENGPEETGNSKDGTQNAGVEANFFDSDDFGDDDEDGGVDARAADTLQCAKDNPMKQKMRKT